MTTGDRIDPKSMVYADESDIQVASRVRMLFRDQLDHEAVCTGARDRIMYLSQQVERLTTEVTALKDKLDGAETALDAQRSISERLTAESRLKDAVIEATRYSLKMNLDSCFEHKKDGPTQTARELIIERLKALDSASQPSQCSPGRDDSEQTDNKLMRGSVVMMKASSGLVGYGNEQCVSSICEPLGTLSLFGHNQHYKIYDVAKITEMNSDHPMSDALDRDTDRQE